MYNLPIERTATHRHMGKIMRNTENNRKWRKKDWKKAIIDLDYEVDPEFQKII